MSWIFIYSILHQMFTWRKVHAVDLYTTFALSWSKSVESHAITCCETWMQFHDSFERWICHFGAHEFHPGSSWLPFMLRLDMYIHNYIYRFTNAKLIELRTWAHTKGERLTEYVQCGLKGLFRSHSGHTWGIFERAHVPRLNIGNPMSKIGWFRSWFFEWVGGPG